MATRAILVIEPDEHNAKLLDAVLVEEGYEVTNVRSLEEAIVLLSDRPSRALGRFDLIITEAFNQSDYYRFDPAFLADLKSVAGDTPIVLSSVYPSTERLRAGAFGLAEVVRKPFTIEELLEKVHRLLG